MKRKVTEQRYGTFSLESFSADGPRRRSAAECLMWLLFERGPFFPSFWMIFGGGVR